MMSKLVKKTLTISGYILICLAFFLFSSMSSCMRNSIERRYNYKNIIVLDSLALKNNNYAFLIEYNLGGIYGTSGYYVVISDKRQNIERADEVIVSDYIKGIRKVSDSELQIIGSVLKVGE